MIKYSNDVPDCYTKLTRYNPCIHNIIIHTLQEFQVDCFSDKEIKEVKTWSICNNKKYFGNTF